MASATVSTAINLKSIFFVTDFAPASRLAFPFMIALATRYHSRVTLVHALGAVPFAPIPYEPMPPLDQRPRQLVLPQMEELRKECVANGLTTRIALKDGEPVEVLNSELNEMHADLIVMGTHAHGSLHRLLMGSHAERITRNSPCGVLMVGPHAVGSARWRDRIARIVLATNFEEGSRHALDYLAPLATEHRSDVTILHVVDEPAGVPLDMAELQMHASQEQLQKFADGTKLVRDPHLQIRIGHPHQEIVSLAHREDMDLIVLGRRKGGFLAEHRPSTTIALVTAQAPCPVLTLC